MDRQCRRGLFQHRKEKLSALILSTLVVNHLKLRTKLIHFLCMATSGMVKYDLKSSAAWRGKRLYIILVLARYLWKSYRMKIFPDFFSTIKVSLLTVSFKQTGIPSRIHEHTHTNTHTHRNTQRISINTNE